VTGFLSDNVSGVHPAIADALLRANSGYAMPYGDDDLSKLLDDRYSRVFETEVNVLPCVTGTAANGLSIALLAKSYNSVCVHADAHIYLDECNAPEFFSGGARQVRIHGPDGKMDPGKLEQAFAALGERHSAQPSAVSVAQATELGTLYSPQELETIGSLLRSRGLGMHMDGARFANAVAALGCRPRDITSRVGVDVLSFGATKNGCLAAEAVVLFDTSLAGEARYRMKQAGQMLSKQRFLAAQLRAYVEDGLWLDSARHANRQAARLASRLQELDGVELLHPATTNTIYVKFPARMVAALQAAGLAGYVYDNSYMRLVCSWATGDEEIDRFLATLGKRD
jgi:threonine aldolase